MKYLLMRGTTPIFGSKALSDCRERAKRELEKHPTQVMVAVNTRTAKRTEWKLTKKRQRELAKLAGVR